MSAGKGLKLLVLAQGSICQLQSGQHPMTEKGRADGLSLITAHSCVEDARKYLPELCARRRWAVAPALELLDALLIGSFRRAK